MNKKLLVIMLALTMMVLCGSMFASSIQSIRIIDANTDGTIDAVDVYLTANIDDNATLGLKADATNGDKATLMAQFAFTSGIVPLSSTSISTGLIANDNILRIELTPTEGTSYTFSMDYDVDPGIAATKIITGTTDYLLSFSGQIASDRAKPIVKQTTIRDNDNNGRVDEVVIVFTESMNGTITSTSGMSLGGNYDGATLAANGTWSASTTTFTIPITNPNYAGAVAGNTSDPLQLITFSAVSILDAQGNKPIMGNYHGGITYVDEAKPVLMSSETVRIAETNYVRAYFSEALNNAFLAYTDITLASAPEFTFTTYKYTAGNKYVDFGGTVPNGLVSNTNNQIALSGSGVVADVNGNTSSATGNVYVIDKIAPWLVAAYTHDINNDGATDYISLAWSEKVKDTTFDSSDIDFTNLVHYNKLGFVTGYSDATSDGNSWVTNVASDELLSLHVEGTDFASTSVTPTVAFAGGTITDINDCGNIETSLTAVDAARPVLTAAKTIRKTNNNYIQLTVSEAVNPLTVTTADADIHIDGVVYAAQSIGVANFEALGNGTYACTFRTTPEVPGGFTEGATSTIDLASAGCVLDLAGNGNELNSIQIQDEISPYFMAAYTHDLNNDGDIDYISIEWSEDIHDADLITADFTVTDATVTAVSTAYWDEVSDNDELLENSTQNVENDQYVTLSVAITGTSATPTVGIAFGQNVYDLNGNNTSVSDIVPADKACPVVLSNGYYSSYIMNKNYILVQFSEAIDLSSVDTNGADFSYKLDMSTTKTIAHAGGKSIDDLSLLKLDPTETLPNYIDESTAHIRINNGQVITDKNGNNTETPCEQILNDKVAPRLLSALTHDMNNDGKIDRISFTWSESVDLDAINVSDIVIDGFTSTAKTPNYSAIGNDYFDPEWGEMPSPAGDECFSIATSANNNEYNTGLIPLITVAVNKVNDLNGNGNDSYSGDATDAARPVALRYSTAHINNNNYILMHMSEAIDDNTLSTADYEYTIDNWVSNSGIDSQVFFDDENTVIQLAGTTPVPDYVDPTLAAVRFSVPAAVADIAENTIENQYQMPLYDEIAPYIVAAYTHDLDDNGKIDHIDVKWSETVNGFTASDFSVSDATVSSVVTGYWSAFDTFPAIDTDKDGTLFDSPNVSAEDKYMSLVFTGENEIEGTGVTPTVAVQAQGDIRDLNNNKNVAETSTTAVDLAAPVPLEAWTAQEPVPENSSFDNILKIKFSELLSESVLFKYQNMRVIFNGNEVTAPPEDIYPCDGADMQTITFIVEGIPNELDQSKVNAIQFTYDLNNLINDAADNANAMEFSYEIGIADSARPYVVHIASHDLNDNGTIDALTFTMSERVFIDNYTGQIVVKNGTNNMAITGIIANNYIANGITNDIAVADTTFDSENGEETFTITLSEETFPIKNTYQIPEVELFDLPSHYIRDYAENKVWTTKENPFNPAVYVDAARPVVMTAQTARKDNKNIVKATFSEEMFNAPIENSGITLSFNATTLAATGVVNNLVDHVYEISCDDNGFSLIPTGFSSLPENTTLSVAAQETVDLENNSNDARTIPLLDKIGPYIVQALTHDLNNDGKLDHISLEWSEPMTVGENALTTANFSVTNATIDSISTKYYGYANDTYEYGPTENDDNDNYTDITITGTGNDYNNTYATPIVTISEVYDALENGMVTPTVNTSDAAAPALVGAYLSMGDLSPLVHRNADNWNFVFSEPVDLSNANVFTLTAIGNYPYNGLLPATATNNVANFVTFSALDPRFPAYIDHTNTSLRIKETGIIKEKNGLLRNDSTTPVGVMDKMNPYPMEYVYLDLDNDGDVETIQVTMSENITCNTDSLIAATTITNNDLFEEGIVIDNVSVENNEDNSHSTIIFKLGNHTEGSTLSGNRTGANNGVEPALTINYLTSSINDIHNNRLYVNPTYNDELYTNVELQDNANPVLLKAEADDLGDAGLFNATGETLLLTFSEVIDGNEIAASSYDEDIQFTTDGNNFTSNDSEPVVSSILENNILTFTKLSDGPVSGTVFSPSYGSDQRIYFVGNTASLQDPLGNPIHLYTEDHPGLAVYVHPVMAHILARETVDVNHDGLLDMIKITFDRAMNNQTMVDSQWLVRQDQNTDLIPSVRVEEGVRNTEWLLVLNPIRTITTSWNTGVTPQVKYTKIGETIATGVTGSQLEADNDFVTTVDKAEPVMMTAEWYDINTNGKIDQAVVTFSESVSITNMIPYLAGCALHVTYGGPDGEWPITGAEYTLGSAESISIDFDNTNYDTGIAYYALFYNTGETEENISDLAGNEMIQNSVPLQNLDKAAPYLREVILFTNDNTPWYRSYYENTLPSRMRAQLVFTETLPDFNQSGLSLNYYTRYHIEDSARVATLERDEYDDRNVYANYDLRNSDEYEDRVFYDIQPGFKDTEGNANNYQNFRFRDYGFGQNFLGQSVFMDNNYVEFNIYANTFEFTDWNYPYTDNPKVNEFFTFKVKAVYDEALDRHSDGDDPEVAHTSYLDYDFDYYTQLQTNYPGIVFTPLMASFTEGIATVSNCHSTQAHDDIQIQAINSMYYSKGIGQSQNTLSASEHAVRNNGYNMLITSQNFTVDEIANVDVQGVQDLLASDVPEDNGGWIQLTYKLSDNDPRSTVHAFPAISYYTIERQGTAADTSWYFIKQIPVGYSRILVEVPSTGIASNYRVNSVYDSQNGTVVPARNASPFSTAGIASSMKDTYVVRMADYENNTNTHRNVVTVTSASVTVAEQDNLPAYATVKVLLEGAYKTQTHTMSRTRALTMASPYGQSETVSAITYVNANNPVIDWVGVQVRNSNNQIVNLSGANAAGFVSRLLLADGSIVNIDGSSTYPMFYTTGKNYSFVIKTRNHLSVMSAQNHTVADLGSCVIDLTTSGSIYGPAHKTIDSKEMLVVGDINASNNVTVQDYLLVKNNLGTAVDNRYDVNYDGNVNTSDYLKVKANLNRLTNIPTATTVRGELLATSSKASKKDVANKGSRTAATVTLVPVTNDGSTFAMDMKVDYSGAPSYVAGIDLYVNYNTDALSNPVFTLNGTEGPAGYSVLSPTVSESDPNFAVCLLDEGPSTDWAMGSSTPGNTLKTIGRITWDVTDNTQNSNVSFSTSFPSDLLNAVGDAYDVIFMDPSTMTLPVELTSFTGCETNGHIELNWTVQSENNLSGYNVYHSTSNDVATRVKVNSGNIQATNAATSHSYNYAISEASGTWYYWLESVEMNGGTTLYGPVAITTSISEVAPAVTALETAYPNPFNPSTTIKYSLKQASDVKIVIYNAKGQLVRTLVNGHKEAGYYNATWIGNDDRGNRVASGIYLYKMITKDYVKVQKMMMIK